MQHTLQFDPTYGYDLAALRSVGCPAVPVDFAGFWRETYLLARQSPPRPERRLIRESNRMRIYEVEFDAWNGERPIRIGGWITTPLNEEIHAGMVVGHGYGGCAWPDLSPVIPAAAIYPCVRGFNRSADPMIPGAADLHVLHGIQSRETYVHRGCVIDLWAAAWALMELEPATMDWLCYAGASFGGNWWRWRFRGSPRLKGLFWIFPVLETIRCG